MPARRSEAQNKAKEKYDARTAKQVLLRFNNGTDADILAKLDRVGNKQGYIKELIRSDLK